VPRGRVVRTVPVARTPRVAQLEGYFDLPQTASSELAWDVDIPCDDRPWAIGLLVGPSGSGKSTIAREMFGGHVVTGYSWPPDRSLVDAFPEGMSIKAITGLLSSVGFSSPPAWLRPFPVLSTGEQFRVTLARALAETPADGLTVIDEFTSVVDRRVAQIGSAALAKTVRRQQQRLIAVTCHYDVEEWLQPDWVYQPHLADFQWRELQRRPSITLTVTRCPVSEWTRFRQHHYLSTDINHGARCFLTWCGDEPVGFTAVLPMMGFRGRWREHRTVCLPEFQGVGIGMAQSGLVASIVKAATGGEYFSTTSHPAFIGARSRSPVWSTTRRGGFVTPNKSAVSSGTKTQSFLTARRQQQRAPRSWRLTASFRYSGPAWADVAQARALWSESGGYAAMGGANRRTQTRLSTVTPG